MQALPADLPLQLTLASARVPACLAVPSGSPVPEGDGLVLLDITLEDGRIREVAEHDPAGAGPTRIDLKGRMVWPCPVDMHTHLDKGHIWPRTTGLDGGFAAAIEAVYRDQAGGWTAGDVCQRMEFSLRCAYAHGTCAIRTHIDSTAPLAETSWPVVAEMRERWADRITLQAVSLNPAQDFRGPCGERVASLVAEHGGILGMFPEPGPQLSADLDRFLALAEAHALDVDLHVDESGDPSAKALRHLAEAVLRRGFKGRVVAGHCCSLAVHDPDEAARTLDLVAEAGIAIVSLPMCNLYLQGRQPGRTPRWRGITLVHEIRARGIPLAFASDNTRDPFFAYGDLDMHEVFREAVRIGHLDHPFGDWPASIAVTPAAIMGLAGVGQIRPGASADLILFEGRSWTELLARPESRRIVLRAGRPIDTTLPAYAELDHLFERVQPGATRTTAARAGS